MLSCNSNDTKSISGLDTNLVYSNEQEQIMGVDEKPAKYKNGAHDLWILDITSSIIKITIEECWHYKGIYQFEIDTIGSTSNFNIIRGISNKIDEKVESICDTLEFYPATLNGKAINSKFTFPVRIEIR